MIVTLPSGETVELDDPSSGSLRLDAAAFEGTDGGWVELSVTRGGVTVTQNMTIAAVDAVADPHTGPPLPQLVQNLTSSPSAAAAVTIAVKPGVYGAAHCGARLSGPIRLFAAAGAAATTIDCSGSGGTVLHFDPPAAGRRRLFSAGAEDGATHVSRASR